MGAVTRLDDLPSRLLPGGLRLVRAGTHRQRSLGLARLDAMAPTTALHLAPCRSVHTFGMRFALDLIWLDARGAPVRVDRGVGSHRIRTCLAARSVVEANAGSADAFVAALPLAE
jgi:uncharacterized membrane protein (UPF0127 family)